MENKMFRILTRSAVGTAVALALALAFAAPSSAAPRERFRHESAPRAAGYRNLYNYVPGPSPNEVYNRGNALAPPDPASCGGFHC
jgi:hypothetical protein